MKKFLLSMAVMAFGISAVNAEKITVDFASATNLPSQESEAPASITVNGVEFSLACCKAGVYQSSKYLQISGKNYSGKAYIEFKFDKKLTGFTLTTGASASTNVTVQLSANGENVGDAVKLAEKSADFSFAIPENYQNAGTTYRLATTNKYNAQVTQMVFTLDEAFNSETPDTPVTPVDPTPAGDITIVKATEFEPGNYAFVFNEGVVSTFGESQSYGYWMASAATLSDEMKTTKESIFSIASTDKGYTITDAYGRIMGWDGSHWSFNAYNTAEDGNSYWDVVMTDGTVKISNKTNSAVYLCGKKYNSDYEMCPTDRADQTLPFLYKVKDNGSGVAEVEAAGNAEVVYYNLQGVKVAEPENGLYIKVQGNKATKVLIRK